MELQAARDLVKSCEVELNLANAELHAFVLERACWSARRGYAYQLPPDVTAEISEKIGNHQRELETAVQDKLNKFHTALRIHAEAVHGRQYLCH
jgi:hypothetical protein